MRQIDHWPRVEGPNYWDHAVWATSTSFTCVISCPARFCRRLNCVASTLFGKFNPYSVFVSQWVAVPFHVDGGVCRDVSGPGRWVSRLESIGLRRDVLSRGLRRDRPLPVVRCERRTERERESLAIWWEIDSEYFIPWAYQIEHSNSVTVVTMHVHESTLPQISAAKRLNRPSYLVLIAKNMNVSLRKSFLYLCAKYCCC